MRERITVAFVLLAVAVLVGAGLVRAGTVQDLMREQEAAHLNHNVMLVGKLIVERRADGLPVDDEFLQQLVDPASKLVYTDRAGERMVVTGPDYEAGDNELSATLESRTGRIVVSRPGRASFDVIGRDVPALVTLFLLIGLLAGLAGWLAAVMLSRPFQKLAVAASALGRGRFDLDLPRTRMPEAQAISQSLATSALQLRGRMRRERAFAEHASHVLRTPLTSLRLELEDITLRDDMPDEVKEAAQRCLAGVDAVNASAGELVALSRTGSLVEGAELPLRELATQLAQRWADRLADERRQVSARADGDLSMAFTPGPVEHVLDLVLADIVLSRKGAVELRFLAEQDHLRVTLPAGVIAPPRGRRRGLQPGAGVAEAREMAEAQGGRVTGDGVTEELEILLPRR